jgi:hypothetical protein
LHAVTLRDLLHALCALAAFALPMALGWACLAWQDRRRGARVHRCVAERVHSSHGEPR